MRPDLCPRVTLPELPPDARISIKVQSVMSRGVEYDVDLDELTCSCPDFDKRHTYVDEFDFGRLCKHLRQAYREHAGDLPLLVTALLDRGGARSYHTVQLGTASSFVLGVTPERPWVDVFLQIDDAWKCWGYDLGEQRWSYNTAPPAAAAIAKILQELPVREYSAPE